MAISFSTMVAPGGDGLLKLTILVIMISQTDGDDIPTVSHLMV